MYNNPCWASWSHLTLITHIKGQQWDFSLQDSSDRSLALLSKTDLYTSLRRWEGSYWTRERCCQNEKKHLQAVIPLEVSLTAFHSLRAAKGQNLRVGSISVKREKIMLTLESQLFLFFTRVRGPVIFIGRTADSLILTVYFWLWS